MNEEIKKKLEQEIESQIELLSTLGSGSEERTVVLNELEILFQLDLDTMKVNHEHVEKLLENDIKQEQLKDQYKDRYLKVGIEAAGIVLPLVFYAFWMQKGFKFEEKGIYTSSTFRGLWNRFKPTR